MIVQFRNEKVSNHVSIPIIIDCNVVAFVVFEEGFHQPKKRTKHFCDYFFFADYFVFIIFERYLHIGSIMFSLSTGEPPTPPSPRSTDSVTNDESGLRTLEAAASRVHALATQVRDSGYETPATAICVPSGDLHFFDRDFVTPPAVSSEESLFDVFDDCSESMMLLESENNNDLCPDCGESNSCTCSRTESSSTVRTATSTSNYVVDPNVCDSDTSGQSSSVRTSSLPIIIPRPFPGVHQERPARSNEDNVVSSQERYALLHELTNSRTHPGGYPSRMIQFWNSAHPPSLLQVIDELSRTVRLGVSGASRTINRRNWRRRIDSDSSLSSDEEDYPVHIEESTYAEDLPAYTGALQVVWLLALDFYRQTSDRGCELVAVSVSV
ncbi:uncharacterized protein TNCV_202071 [Trichonephila clavipes]|nr:uncharacterized protein TNCV_202071 [Trichonephila clavipes]